MMSKMPAVFFVLLSAAVARGAVVGQVLSVGFPAVRGLGEGRDLVRPGEWVPVVVRLTLENEDSFDGWIRISQPDKDGDLGYDRQKVHLRRDQTRTYRLYAVAGKPTGRAGFFSVELLSDDHRRVELVSGGQRTRVLTPLLSPDALTDNDYLVLSVGHTVGRVALLEDPDQADKFAKTVRVAHIAPDELPARWQGLQTVDAIVWDKADPTVLKGPQLEALMEWTRQGGVLVIAAGTTADTVAGKMSRLLPIDPGPTRSTAALPEFRRNMLMLSREAGPNYQSPMVVATCTTRTGATTIIAEDNEELKSTIVAGRRVGRGRVVFVAAALSDLLGEEGNSAAFFKRVFELREAAVPGTVYESKNLSDEVDGWVGFKQIGATYLAVAMIFAVIYVFAATLGSWQFLRTRGWLRHSWSAFAVVGVAASTLSVLGVQTVRGVGKKLVQLTVVDAEAGDSTARATAYFGLKTSLFGSLDVWLPHDYPQVVEPEPTECVLYPLPPSSANAAAQHYADPGRYRVVPSRAELLGVPIRGTLKQFEGRWAGTLPGRLRTDLIITPGGPGGKYDWRLTPDSTIVNELGVDLYRCFFIYAAQDLFLPGSTTQIGDRADKVYLFALGGLKQGDTLRPAASLYTDDAGNDVEFKEWSKKTLKAALEDWVKAMGGFSIGELAGIGGKWGRLERHETALLLLSLLGEYTPQVNTGGWTGVRFDASFTTGSCRHLDLSDSIDTQTALFIGFARAAGPVSLCTRRSAGGQYTRVPPTEALTVYRILIPLG